MVTRRILCAIDLSDFTPTVLAYAVALGRLFKADVSALHVFADWMPPADGSTYPHWMLELPQARAAIKEALDAVLAPFNQSGHTIPLHTTEGDAAKEIVRRATEWNADLIIVGTHGRSGYDRLALGSVAEKVLRKAPCPVLTLPPGCAQSAVDVAFTQILVPTDLSSCSGQALTMGLQLAEQSGGAVTALRVVETIDGENDTDVAGAFGEVRRRQVAAEERALQETIATLATAGHRVSAVVTVGRPYQEILRLADDRHADLIVMGVQGRGQVDLALLGSTTNQVVRLATCPVLTVRPK